MTLLLDEQPVPQPVDRTPKTESSGQGWGRRVLLGTAAGFVIIMIASAALAVPHLDDGVGDREYHPTEFTDVDHHYEFGIGTLEVDLRDVEFPPGVHTITVDHGIGSARVWLPADVNYDVTGDLDIGEIDLFGEDNDGFGNELDAQLDRDGVATVIVDLEVDIGYGRVAQG